MLRLAPAHAFCARRTRTSPAPDGCEGPCPLGPLCANAGTASRLTRTVITIRRIASPSSASGRRNSDPQAQSEVISQLLFGPLEKMGRRVLADPAAEGSTHLCAVAPVHA